MTEYGRTGTLQPAPRRTDTAGTEAERMGADSIEADSVETIVLHLWRLLDWRFLLPTPQPRTVAYLGAIDQQLTSAIRLLDPEAVDLGERSPAASPSCEVVLMVQPCRSDVVTALGALQAGGWVCAQVRRTHSLTGPRTLWGWERLFRRSGIQDVQVYWHAPTLASSARIIPLASAAGVRNTLERHEGIRFGRLKSVLGRVAYSIGLMAIAVPEGSIVGRWPIPVAENA